jgi:hypothetical protein
LIISAALQHKLHVPIIDMIISFLVIMLIACALTPHTRLISTDCSCPDGKKYTYPTTEISK